MHNLCYRLKLFCQAGFQMMSGGRNGLPPESPAVCRPSRSGRSTGVLDWGRLKRCSPPGSQPAGSLCSCSCPGKTTTGRSWWDTSRYATDCLPGHWGSLMAETEWSWWVAPWSGLPCAPEFCSPEVSTHLSGLSCEDSFFLPMFMRLLNFRAGPYFFFTAAGRRLMLQISCFVSRILENLTVAVDQFSPTHHLCRRVCRHGCQCCCRSPTPASVSRSALPENSQ